mgnify:CR=1 FL=1|tara:strand:- start:7269 stop:8504 length:1236 start_codon:yes stop_codon:yes gene_type:complete
MQHKILLLDELGERWGQTHIFHDLRSPADAIKLLCINYSDLAKHLATSHEKGIVYKVTQVDQELSESDLFLPLGQHDLVITPVIAGSKGVSKFIIGAILVGVAIGTGGTSLSFGLGGFSGGVGISAAIGNIGLALAVRGVGEMLAPQQPTFDQSINVGQGGFLSGPSSIERGADGQQSYAYRGAANTVGIGKTIPVVYGKALIGGHLISTAIEIENESDKLMTHFEPPSPNTVRVNGNEIRINKKKVEIYEGMKMTRVPLQKKPSTYQGVKFQIDRNNIQLNKKGRQKICNDFDVDESGERNSQNMMLMIDFKGLLDRVGAVGTTLIHGYITFKVIVFAPESESTLLNQQITVQGLMLKNQTIRYVFNFQPAFHDEHPLDLFIEIVDKELLSTSYTQMIIRRIGYKFFKGN